MVSRGWYEDNKTVKECREKSESAKNNYAERISICKRLVKLYDSFENPTEEQIEQRDEYSREEEIIEKEKKMRVRLDKFMSTLPQDKPIQDVTSFESKAETFSS